MALTIPVSEIVERSSNRLLGKHESWGRVLLGDVATVLNGFAFKSAEFSNSDGMPLIRIRDVGKDRSETTYLGDYDPRYVVEPGDLLVGMDGDFNCARWRGERGLLNQRVCKLTLKSNIYLPKFLDYTLPGYLKAINDVTSSVTVKHLSSRSIEQIPLPLPPIEVQKRLVAEIEKQFSRLDEAVANLKRIKANLKRYKAAVLKAAVEGKLTEDWRNNNSGLLLDKKLLKITIDECFKKKKKIDQNRVIKYREADWFYDCSNKIPKEWKQVQLIDVTHLITCGVAKKPEYVAEGIPFLSAQNRKPFSPNLKDIKYVLKDDFKKFTVGGKPEKGDILYSRVGANFGEACVIPWDFDFAVYVSLTIIKQDRNLLDGNYLAIFLNSVEGILQSQGGIMGSGIQNLNVDSVRKYRIPISSLEEQRQIVEEVERRWSVIERIESELKGNLIRADRLRQSVLQTAFSGKLTRPISVLGDKIA